MWLFLLFERSNYVSACVFQLIIKPYHFAVFSVNVVAPKYEGAFAAEVIMSTQFDVRSVVKTFR